MNSIKEPKNDREWRATTGLDKELFGQLLVLFQRGYESCYGRSLAERLEDNPGTEPTFKTYRDLLFFTLFSLKSGLTFDVLGFVFQMDVSNAKRNQTLGLEVLKRALGDAGYLPERSLDTPEAFWEHFAAHKAIILDGTEQRIQRPKNKETQQAFYSGKKKSHG
jgi:hypothetical protein